MKNFIKNNKVTVVAFIICVIFVILVFAVKLTFFPNEGTAIYGGETASGTYYEGATLTAVNKRYATDKNWANGVFKWMTYLYNKL